jgi:prefoldin subunit 5
MLDEQMKAIQNRWQASTPGEWITTAGSEGSLYENRIVCLQGEYTDPDAKLIDLIDMSGVRDDCTAEDLQFIAEAHQDIPALLDEIKQLRFKLDHLRAQVEQLTADAAEWRRAYNTLERSEFQLREELSEAYSQINILRAQVDQLTADALIRADRQMILIEAMKRIELNATDSHIMRLAAGALNAIGEAQP